MIFDMDSIYLKNMISQLFPEKDIILNYMNIPLFVKNIIPRKDISDFTIKKGCRFDQDDFKIRFLSEEELDRLNGYKSLKKQIEWLAGRFLVKNMVKEFVDFGNTELFNIKLAYKEEGAPFLEQFPSVTISITHSGNYAAAAMCRAPKNIGLDIERSDYLPAESFMRMAFTEREIANIEFNSQKRFNSHDDLSDQQRLTLSDQNKFYAHHRFDGQDVMEHWTVKEAFLKYIGRGFNERLKAVEILDDTIFYNGQEVMNIMIHRFDIESQYLLSLIYG